MENVKDLSDPEMMKCIREGQADIKAGRTKRLRGVSMEDAR